MGTSIPVDIYYRKHWRYEDLTSTHVDGTIVEGATCSIFEFIYQFWNEPRMHGVYSSSELYLDFAYSL